MTNKPPDPDDSKKKALELALAKLDKDLGKGSVIRLGNDVEPWPFIPTGALTLDVALGIGGLPRGRIIEAYGPLSSGKSTIALSAVAEVQKAGGIAAYIDAEHSLDPQYMQAVGVNMDELLLSQPFSGEDGLQVVDTLTKSGAVSLIVVDSVSALTPRIELEGDMGASYMGLQSRMMSQALRKLVGYADSTKTTILFINQLREKIGIMFGSPITTSGGRALGFYASVRMDIGKEEDITDKDTGEIIGIRSRVKVVKNKLAPAYKIAKFNILFGKGIDQMRCVLDVSESRDLIKKSGAWYSYKGEQIGQGPAKACSYLEDHPDIVKELKEQIIGLH